MANTNRSSLLTKTHKVLKKHYQPVPAHDRPVLEQLLFAACLENASYDAAEAALARLNSDFFDLNEVRVASLKELTEVLDKLPDSAAAASHVKNILQHVFETTYSFDLEGLRKQNLGQAVNYLKAFRGVTPFVCAVVTQQSLGGHAIPVDQGSLEVLEILGIITRAEAAAGQAPGAERAIPKNKGIEFGSLLHQLGADYYKHPNSTNLHKTLLEIAPDCKERIKEQNARKVAKAAEPVAKPKPPAPFDAKAAAAASVAKKSGAAAAAGKKPGDSGKLTGDAAKKAADAAKKSADAAKKKAPDEKSKKALPSTPKKPPAARKAVTPALKKKQSSPGISKKKPR